MVSVSIVTPCFNSAKYISACIASVLSQTYSDWELLVVDDCSTDDSVVIVQAFMELDSRIRLVCLDSNSGAAVARNRGIELACGRYIAFLDSDDLWLPNKLEQQVEFMDAQDVAFSYSAYERIDECKKHLGFVGVPDRLCYSDLLKVCSVGCLTAIYSVEKLGKIYMPLIRKRQDLGLWLRIMSAIPYAYATPGVLAQYRVRADSISANKWVAAKYTWTLYRAVERLSLVCAVYYFFHYAINGLLRTKFPVLARLLGVLK